MSMIRFQSILLAALASVAVFSVAGCGDDGSGSSTPAQAATVDPANAQDGDNAKFDTEEKADEGEALLTFQTLDQAQAKFQEAIAIDPDNARAGLWIRMIKALKNAEGIAARIQPLFDAVPGGHERYIRAVESSLSGRSQAYRSFYENGRPDIETGEELQEVLGRAVLDLADLREYLYKIRNQEIRIHVPFQLIDSGRNGDLPVNQQCQGGSFGPIPYQPTDCDSNQVEYIMNAADFTAVQGVVGEMQIELALLSAYQTDAQAVVDMMDPVGGDSAKSPLKHLIDNHAKLRADNRLADADLALQDSASAFEYEMMNQNTACPGGATSYNSRPGYLFAFGVCLDLATGNRDQASDARERSMRIAEAILNHRPIDITLNTHDDQPPHPSLFLDAHKLLTQPITDIGVLGPATVNACGAMTSLNTDPLKPYLSGSDLSVVIADYFTTYPLTCDASGQ